ncbi:sodium:solute symporter family transporter, partial [Treponema sp. R80B11-R83G3]
ATSLKICASIILFIFLIPYTASLYNGLSRLFEMAFHVDFIYCIIGMAVLTAVYVVVGGYFATAANDFIQGIIMLCGIVAIIAAVLHTNGGFINALAKMATVEAKNVNGAVVPGVLTSFFGPDPLSLLG